MARNARQKSDSDDAGRDESSTESSDVEESGASASSRDTRADELRDSERDRTDDYGEVY